MGSREVNSHFSVFDGVKTFPLTPDALMVEFHTGNTNLEYADVTSLLYSPSSSLSRDKGRDSPKYDARAEWLMRFIKLDVLHWLLEKFDEAFHSSNVSLSKCLPQKTSTVAKRQSLISLTSHQLHKSSVSN